MSTDAPTPGELSRLITAIRDDQRNGFAAINSRLDRLVSTELFSADQRRVDERLKDLADGITDEREARAAQIKDQRVALDKLTTNLRWLAAAIILPIGLFLANIVLGR